MVELEWGRYKGEVFQISVVQAVLYYGNGSGLASLYEFIVELALKGKTPNII